MNSEFVKNVKNPRLSNNAFILLVQLGFSSNMVTSVTSVLRQSSGQTSEQTVV
jgi:hypothetical protein